MKNGLTREVCEENLKVIEPGNVYSIHGQYLAELYTLALRAINLDEAGVVVLFEELLETHDGNCRFDHNGNCQEHYSFADNYTCVVKDSRECLAKLKALEGSGK